MNLPKIVLQLLLGKRLPITSGQLKLHGPEKPITIHRDQYGIPYIEAQTERDAYYALGFCQGQDRMFQLEMLLRITRGTLAELIGEDGLVIDKFARRIGFNRYAKGHYNILEPKYQRLVDAFAQGINEGASVGCKKKPHEFAILRADPTPWDGVDVLGGGNYIAFGLSTWTKKITRLIVLQKDGPEALKALDPGYADWQPATQLINLPVGPVIDRLVDDLAKLTEITRLGGASNNWALQSSRTATGRPLLANDPHLWPSLPAPWYLAHLQAPGLKVAGATFAGSPTIPSGNNEFAAWGVTATLADNIDLFIEELSQDGRSVRQGDEYIPCEILKQTYQIKGAEPVEEDVVITPRGPIVSDALQGVPGVISMRATWMSPFDCSGLIEIHRIKDFENFRETAKRIRLVSQNFVYADTADDVGWQYTTDVPQRGAAWGTLPLPGWDARFQWKADSTPWEEMPFLKNPPTGFVATANAKPTQDGEGPYFGADFIDGYRHTRIVESLETRSDWDLKGMLTLQLDQFAVVWREIKDFVLAIHPKDEDCQLALNLLKEWDGISSADSSAALVFEYFMMEMDHRKVQSKAPNSGEWALGRGFHPLVLESFFPIQFTSLTVKLLNEQPDGWFERSWPDEVADALTSVVQRVRGKFGPDPKNWNWGQAHMLTMAHPLGVRAPLDKIFNRGPYPTGGNAQTVAQAGRASLEWGKSVIGLANLRRAVDVGKWEDNYAVIAGGQSGNPFSPHYDDLLHIWLRGQAVTMPWTQDAIRQAAKQTLQLLPG